MKTTKQEDEGNKEINMKTLEMLIFNDMQSTPALIVPSDYK